MSTLTSTAATSTASVRYQEAGVVERHVRLVTGDVTLSDIILMVKIPDQATITAVYGSGNSPEALSSFKMGITGNGTETTFASLISLSVGAVVAFDSRDELAVPFKLSMTDNAVPHHGFIYLTPSTGTWTTSHTIDLVVRYSNDGA